jgi:two-component system response regulator BaeR
MTHTKPQVLIAEDDDQIAAVLVDYLREAGFATHRVANGDDALQAVRHSMPSALILDIMLPGMDGIAVCQSVRQFSQLPILMLTAKSDEEDRLVGLDSGADDYVCKPFSPREIVARVRGLVRRASANLSGAVPSTGFAFGDAGERIRWGGEIIPLTKVEERLLRTMASQPRRVFTREALLNILHDEFRDIGDRAIDTHIKNLRRKLKQLVADRDFIHAMYGVGYYFEE